jgi:hypothetical protein
LVCFGILEAQADALTDNHFMTQHSNRPCLLLLHDEGISHFDSLANKPGAFFKYRAPSVTACSLPATGRLPSGPGIPAHSRERLRTWSARLRVSNDQAYSQDAKDEGPGLTPQNQTRRFERDVQLSAHLSGGEICLGYGLAVAKEMIEHIDGRIWGESIPGQGDGFAFELP